MLSLGRPVSGVRCGAVGVLGVGVRASIDVLLGVISVVVPVRHQRTRHQVHVQGLERRLASGVVVGILDREEARADDDQEQQQRAHQSIDSLREREVSNAEKKIAIMAAPV